MPPRASSVPRSRRLERRASAARRTVGPGVTTCADADRRRRRLDGVGIAGFGQGAHEQGASCRRFRSSLSRAPAFGRAPHFARLCCAAGELRAIGVLRAAARPRDACRRWRERCCRSARIEGEPGRARVTRDAAERTDAAALRCELAPRTRWIRARAERRHAREDAQPRELAAAARTQAPDALACADGERYAAQQRSLVEALGDVLDSDERPERPSRMTAAHGGARRGAAPRALENRW